MSISYNFDPSQYKVGDEVSIGGCDFNNNEDNKHYKGKIAAILEDCYVLHNYLQDYDFGYESRPHAYVVVMFYQIDEICLISEE